jgi:hypothetical protein
MSIAELDDADDRHNDHGNNGDDRSHEHAQPFANTRSSA